MARTAIQHRSYRVQRLLGKYTAQELQKVHPKISGIINDTIATRYPRRLSFDTLLRILQGCPVISTPAVDEATGYRYAYSTLAEYAAMARVASTAIENHLDTRELAPCPKHRQGSSTSSFSMTPNTAPSAEVPT